MGYNCNWGNKIWNMNWGVSSLIFTSVHLLMWYDWSLYDIPNRTLLSPSRKQCWSVTADKPKVFIICSVEAKGANVQNISSIPWVVNVPLSTLCTYQFVTSTYPPSPPSPLTRAYHGHLTPSPREFDFRTTGRGGEFDTKLRKVGNLTVRTRRAKRKC